MKIIFLDIDGVLNAEEDYYSEDGSYRKGGAYVTTTNGERFRGVSQKRVKRLSEIVSATGANIVLCSSWKTLYEAYTAKRDDEHVGRYLSNALSRKKLRVLDTTLRFEENAVGYDRGMAIKKWIADWDGRNPSDPIEAFAILDDELFDYQQLGLMGHLVKTEYDEYPGGLTDEKAAEAIRILKGEEK